MLYSYLAQVAGGTHVVVPKSPCGSLEASARDCRLVPEMQPARDDSPG